MQSAHMNITSASTPSKRDVARTSPSLSSISGIAPHSSTTTLTQHAHTQHHRKTAQHVRHFTISKYPLLAAACSAVRPVRGEASFASSNGSTSSERTAFLNSVWMRRRSPDAAAACSASSCAALGWLFDGTGECSRAACTSGSGVGVPARGGDRCTAGGGVGGVSGARASPSVLGYTNSSSSESSCMAGGEFEAGETVLLATLHVPGVKRAGTGWAAGARHSLFDGPEVVRGWVEAAAHSREESGEGAAESCSGKLTRPCASSQAKCSVLIDALDHVTHLAIML